MPNQTANSTEPPAPLIWITHSERYPHVDLSQMLTRALAAGLPAAILRERQLSFGNLYRTANHLQSIANDHNAYLAISDRADIYIMLGLSGVHLAADSPPPSEIRKLMGSDAVISQSVHSVEEATFAQEQGCDFVVAGSVFPNRCHPEGNTMGLAGLAEICSAVETPVIALGGFDADNVRESKECGAAGVAVIGAIYDSVDMEETIAKLLSPWS